jgi:L,D-transpeptidase YnhG
LGYCVEVRLNRLLIVIHKVLIASLLGAFLLPLTLQASVKKTVTSSETQFSANLRQESEAEAKLIHIYQLISVGQNRQALLESEQLIKVQPNFQLAQLVRGDLLSSFVRPVRGPGDVPHTAAISTATSSALADLREESQLRLKALRERPPVGSLPSQFLALSPRNKHAIAVDASRSRLYLFENSGSGVKLIADYYISVGKSGIEKLIEGDQRTPVGVYFITNNLDPKTLKDFYGAGALPINYPNPLDVRRGKTGSGIWLHGTPPDQFSRAPRATDGCVVMANTDLGRIMNTVGIRTTPVVIAEKLQWVPVQSMATEGSQFSGTLQAWRKAKSKADLPALINFYAPDFSSYGKNLVQWTKVLTDDVSKLKGRDFTLVELSMMRWTDKSDTMVVTFDEVPVGMKTGTTKRQYWMRDGKSWKIFFEGSI